jgi:transposase-like protein
MPSSAFAGYRFPPEVITLAVRWYLRFGLSYRDVEELLAERGVEVDHVISYGGSSGSHRSSPRPPGPVSTSSGIAGTSIETYVKIGGIWRYLFRAIDQFGQVIDVFLSPRRDAGAARCFFEQAIDGTRISPVQVTTDRYRVYPRVLDELLPAAFHDTEVHANNPSRPTMASEGSTSTDARPETRRTGRVGPVRYEQRCVVVARRAFAELIASVADLTSWAAVLKSPRSS